MRFYVALDGVMVGSLYASEVDACEEAERLNAESDSSAYSVRAVDMWARRWWPPLSGQSTS